MPNKCDMCFWDTNNWEIWQNLMKYGGINLIIVTVLLRKDTDVHLYSNGGVCTLRDICTWDGWFFNLQRSSISLPSIWETRACNPPLGSTISAICFFPILQMQIDGPVVNARPLGVAMTIQWPLILAEISLASEMDPGEEIDISKPTPLITNKYPQKMWCICILQPPWRLMVRNLHQGNELGQVGNESTWHELEAIPPLAYQLINRALPQMHLPSPRTWEWHLVTTQLCRLREGCALSSHLHRGK